MKTAPNLILFLLLLFSCTKSEIDTEPTIEGTLIRINSYTETCQGFIEQTCLLVQTGEAIGTDVWTYFYDGINGFEYVPGFIYDLDVKITERNHVPQDVGRYEYTLIKEISRTAVD